MPTVFPNICNIFTITSLCANFTVLIDNRCVKSAEGIS